MLVSALLSSATDSLTTELDFAEGVCVADWIRSLLLLLSMLVSASPQPESAEVGILELPAVGELTDVDVAAVALSLCVDPLDAVLEFLWAVDLDEDGFVESPGAFAESACDDEDVETTDEEAGRRPFDMRLFEVCEVEGEADEDAFPARRSAQVMGRPLPLGRDEVAADGEAAEALEAAVFVDDMVGIKDRKM